MNPRCTGYCRGLISGRGNGGVTNEGKNKGGLLRPQLDPGSRLVLKSMCAWVCGVSVDQLVLTSKYPTKIFLPMSDDQNRNGRFEPIHEAHSIEQVLFVLQIGGSLDDLTFSKVREVAEQFVPELPGRSEIQSLTVAIGTPGPVGQIPSGPLGGMMFRRTRPDGTIESELRVERASITFRTTLYTRWDAVWTHARKYFDALIQKYIAQAPILAINLNFVDKFVWTGKAAECRPDLLLQPGSEYLCPHIYTAQDLWHSHTGAFLRIDNKTKRLLNVNVDCVDENRSPTELRRVITITTVLVDSMNQPGYEPTEIMANNACEFLGTRMHQLHLFSKKVFGNTINDAMRRRIALLEQP